MKKLFAIASALLAAVLSSGTVQAAQTVTFGTFPEFPPFEFVASKGLVGQYDGIDIAIVKQIAEENGFQLKIENLEFDSLIMALKGGKIDAIISGMTITKERKRSVLFSDPYFVAKQVMIVPAGSAIRKAADMKGRKIVVIQGYTGETCVKKMGYAYDAFKKGSDAMLELRNGKCDVVVLDSATAIKYAADAKGVEIREDDAAFGIEEYGIAVKKGNEELMKKINASLAKMKKDGTVEKLIKKYVAE